MPFYALHWQERRSNIAIALIHQPNIALDLCPFPKQVATHATLSRDSISEGGKPLLSLSVLVYFLKRFTPQAIQRKG